MSTRVIALLILSATTSQATDPVGYSIDLSKASSGFDGSSCWVHARAGMLRDSSKSASGHATAIMTTQKLLLSGSDIFYALNELRSSDGGATWTVPRQIDSFARQTFSETDKPLPTGADIAPHLLQPGDQTTVCDFVPKWHAQSKRLLGIGHTVWYRNNKVMHVRPRGIAYAVYDSETGKWGKWECVKLPRGLRFQCAGSGSQQRVDLLNGDILVPVYHKEPLAKQYASTVCRCSFDGTTLKYIEHGSELSVPVKRGLYEPVGHWVWWSFLSDIAQR